MDSKHERVSVRAFGEADLPQLVHHGNDIAVWRTLRDRFPYPYSEADARAWLDFVATAQPVTNFAIAYDDACVGGIGYLRRTDVERHSAEVGYWLGKEFWGRGIATTALSLFVAHVFETSDLIRLDATVFDTNPASARVLEKCGFRREGILRRAVVKDGRVLDSYLYSLLRDDRPPGS